MINHHWSYNRRRRREDKPTLEELGKEVNELREVLDGVLTGLGASVDLPYHPSRFIEMGRDYTRDVRLKPIFEAYAKKEKKRG